MKKFILDIILLLGVAGIGVFAAFLVTGNKEQGLTPQETVKTFYTALTEGNWDEAMQVCDSASAGMKEYVAAFKSRFEKHHKQDSTTAGIASRILKKMEIIFGDGNKNRDTYTACYTLKTGNMDKEKKAVLRKIEGKWLITCITAQAQ